MLYKFSVVEQGFTLIELLIAMAISGIVIGAAFSFLIGQRQYLNVQEQVTDMIQNARAAMDMITSEVTMAGYDPSGAKTFSGIPYDSAKLKINADLNSSGFIDGSNESITYAYKATEKRITRDTGGGGQPFAENIQAFTFQYLDVNGNPTTVTANIRQMRITLTVRASKLDPQYAENGGYRTYTLTSLVTPRNLAF